MTKRARRGARGPVWRIARCFLILGLLAGFFIYSQTAIQTETIEAEGAPSAFDGFRVVVISDVHGTEFGEGNERLLKETEELRPDIIAITGDLVHDKEQLSMVPDLARGLSAIAPSYYVTGNHEWAAKCVPELKELLESCGVTVLSNEYEMIRQGGQSIALLGADDNNGWADQKTTGELASEVRTAEGEDTYLLLLSHRNNRYETYEKAGIDLTLAGHGHGGIIRIPGTDGLIGPNREFLPDYTAGLYPLTEGQMVVSCGLGNQWPAFRLFNRPHLPVVVLQSEG